MHTGPVGSGRGRQPVGAEREGGFERLGQHRAHPCPQRRQPQQPAKQARARQHPRQKAAIEPLRQGPPVVAFDHLPPMVDQVHVVHARGTGRGAGQTAQAAVEVFDHVFGRLAVVLQHVLEQVNPPPGAVQLVTEQLVGRAGPGAQPTVHTAAENRLGALGCGVSFHAVLEESMLKSLCMRPGLSVTGALGGLDLLLQGLNARAERLEAAVIAAVLVGALHQQRVPASAAARS